ncbi:MAG: penicillin-binding protein 2 [Candidatus Omnitrophota bacterium]|jgi:penicillin-binding protein 2
MLSDRVKVVKFLVFVSFVFLLSALFYFQIIRYSHFRSLSLKNTVRTIPLKASRGSIYDRNGLLLAKDDMSFNLVLIPQEISDLDDVIGKLSVITGRPGQELKASYKKNYRLPFVPADIITGISPEKAFAIDERLVDAPGALIWAVPKRLYPNGKTGSHVIGYIGKIGDSELKRLKDYGYTIRDDDGGMQIEVDSRSREVSRIGFKEPVKGKDIILSIDLGLQRFMDSVFEDKKGACIVMEAKTGAILGLVSGPEFDPNIFISGKSHDRVKVLNDKGHPLLNRAITSSYPPGSTFKIIMAAAGIGTGAVKEKTSFFCNGVFRLGNASFRCWKETGHGYQDVVEALSHSCNVFFYNLGKALGVEQIYKYASCFGLGSLTGIDLPQEVKGTVPNPVWKRLNIKAPWYEGDTINYSIGQGYLEVTPIQMLKTVTIAANSGSCPQPFVVDSIGGVKIAKKKEYNTRLRPELFRMIKQGLFKCINDQTGTGQNAAVKGVAVSGKTGTAQSGPSRVSHAWFIGYFPSEDPAVSMVVCVEHGGKGGEDAAIAARLITTYIKENHVIGACQDSTN